MRIQEGLWRHSGIASAAIRASHSDRKVHPSASRHMIDISVSRSNASDSILIKRTSPYMVSNFECSSVKKKERSVQKRGSHAGIFFKGGGCLTIWKKKAPIGKTSPPSKFRGGGGGGEERASPLATGQIETLHRGSVLLHQMRCSVSPWGLSFFEPQTDCCLNTSTEKLKVHRNATT